MNQILTIGQEVTTFMTKRLVTAREYLGGGGQGEVYRATMDGRDVALKWYLSSAATPEQRGALDALTKQPPPSDRFLWPLDLVDTPNVPGFGYVMPLRDAKFRGIVDLMKRRSEPTFFALATAGYELAHSFLLLHARGLCYRDISFGNVFFDPDTGQVLICDNDNVTFDGTGRATIKGTPRFMAPEIVRGEAEPSGRTDLFSLAVLLFYMFFLHHPLEGKREASIHCFDLAAMNTLYGTDPLFIFDPANRANEPDPDYQPNPVIYWSIYPTFLRELFTRAFTAGLTDPEHGRVRESEWRQALVRLRDSIIYCGTCRAENFYDVDALRATAAGGGAPVTCWACSNPVPTPPRIRIERQIVALNHDTKLFPHHLDANRLYDFSTPLAEVTPHPRDPSIWGLRNLSANTWMATFPDGSMQQVEPGRSVSILVGAKVHFGNLEGEFRV